MNVTFVDEEGADAGGPIHEIFHLALQAMANDGQLFHGPFERRSFVRNVQAVAMRKFFAGVLVAIYLANGGPGLPCMSKAVFTYICYGLGAMVEPELDDISDFEIKEKLSRGSTGFGKKEP